MSSKWVRSVFAVAVILVQGAMTSAAWSSCGAIPSSGEDFFGRYNYYIDQMISWHERAIDAYRVDMPKYQEYAAKSKAAGDKALEVISDADEMARSYTAFQLRTFYDGAKHRKNARTIVGDNVYNTFEAAERLAYQAYQARRDIEDACRDDEADNGSGTGWDSGNGSGGSSGGSGSGGNAKFTCRIRLAFYVYEGWGNSFDAALEQAIQQCSQIHWESICRGMTQQTCKIAN